MGNFSGNRYDVWIEIMVPMNIFLLKIYFFISFLFPRQMWDQSSGVTWIYGKTERVLVIIDLLLVFSVYFCGCLHTSSQTQSAERVSELEKKFL